MGGDSTSKNADSSLPRLFNTEGAWAFNMWDFLRDYRYVDGFRRAAEVLMTRALDTGAGSVELTMPILFSYRQWAELRLKILWILGGELREDDVEPRKTHDLRVLWGCVRPIIEERWPEGDPQALDRVEAVLHELADIDGPRGTGFRYPVNAKGEDSLPPGLAVDLSVVRELMDEVYLLLEGAAAGIQEWLAIRSDLEAEFRPEY